MDHPLRFVRPPRGSLQPNNAVDPLHFYYHPLVGRLFVARLETGLRLLDRRFERLLEVGYGSGLLLPTLALVADELTGVDIEAEPEGLRERLATLGVRPHRLVRSGVEEMPFADGEFDGVVAFSILEHLRRPALERACAEVARVLEPGGLFLVGCPAVNLAMSAAFAAIGFRSIGDHHFSGLPTILEACAPWFAVEASRSLPTLAARFPLGWAPYTSVLLRRR